MTDPLRCQAEEIQHVCAFGQHMQRRRDEQGQRYKADEEGDGDEFIVLAFSASSCNIRRMTQSLWVSVSVCPCSPGSVRDSVGSFVFPGHPPCGAQRLSLCAGLPLPQWDQIPSTLRKNSRGAEF